VRVVDIAREELRLGGAGNVANNLSALGCKVMLCGGIGGDATGVELRHVCSRTGMDDTGVFIDPQRITSRKIRVLAAKQQIVRIDRETCEPLRHDTEEKLIRFVKQSSSECDVILISDYLKGGLTDTLLSTIMQVGAFLKIPVVVGAKGTNFTRYRGATLLVINRKEAEQASGVSIPDTTALHRAAKLLLKRFELEALLITHGDQGMSLFLPGGEVTAIPTIAREVYDVTGAGDTVLAVMGLALAGGVDFAGAAFLANMAAGITVGKIGATAVTSLEIIEQLQGK
jgi:D-beta-D-heptose 7-phosphate kinase/D-beta-D-heptose 1-phosphate adenosyltransferase